MHGTRLARRPERRELVTRGTDVVAHIGQPPGGRVALETPGSEVGVRGVRRVERRRRHPGTAAELADLHRLTRGDLDDDAIRAATVVALVGLGTHRLAALLDLREALASGAVDEWANALAQEAS